MDYKVEFTKTASNSIAKLSNDMKSQIKHRIIWLAENCDMINHKRLKGKYYENIYKLRLGDYRVLYTLNKKTKTIIIELIGHRKEIYKN